MHRFDETVEVRLPGVGGAWRAVEATLLAHAVDDVDGEWWANVRVDNDACEGEVPEWVPVWCVYRDELGDDDGVVEAGNVIELPSRRRGDELKP